MQENQIRICPVCKTNNTTLVLEKDAVNFDGFNTFKKIIIAKCIECGCLYNNQIEEKELVDFYIYENPYNSQTSFGTGGLGEGDKKRYELYKSILKKYLPENAIICDVGCAKGGSVEYLSKDFPNFIGIELDEHLVKIANSANIKVYKTELYNYPLEDNSIDCLFYTHVFEHVLDFTKLFAEIHRVLKQDGLLFIEVPNSSGYKNNRLFDFYWFFIREHINHFSATSLKNLLNKHSFNSLSTEERSVDYNQAKYSYPSLIGVFSKIDDIKTQIEFDEEKLDEYIDYENNKIKEHCSVINEAIIKNKNVYFWGIGQECFTLLSFLAEKDIIDKCYFVDKSMDKQTKSVKRKKVQSPDILMSLNPEDTFVVISSVFNSLNIRKDLLSMNSNFNYLVLD